MSSIVESTLQSIGFEIMNRSGSKPGSSDATQRFLSFFGASPLTLAVIWRLLFKNLLLDGAEYQHLLWGYMLLKQYSGDRNLASSAGADEKTFRKWAWHIIDAVSWLEGEVVSF